MILIFLVLPLCVINKQFHVQTKDGKSFNVETEGETEKKQKENFFEDSDPETSTQEQRANFFDYSIVTRKQGSGVGDAIEVVTKKYGGGHGKQNKAKKWDSIIKHEDPNGGKEWNYIE